MEVFINMLHKTTQFLAHEGLNNGNAGVREVNARESREHKFLKKLYADEELLSKCEKMTDKEWLAFLDEEVGKLSCAK